MRRAVPTDPEARALRSSSLEGAASEQYAQVKQLTIS